MKDLLCKLQNPPKEYRPIPFWSWNDKLEPEMLKWQINEMKKTGHGGYFMHARGGLETEYLSEDWMECIQAGIDEGKKVGMNTWAYDENGWPSGFAGGLIPEMGEKYHMRWIEPIQITDASQVNDDSTLGIYEYDTENSIVKRININQVESLLINKKKVYIIKQKTNPYYIDILNKEVVKAFIDSTYEVYYERFKDEFGKGLKGFFTDEPQYARAYIPWSNILPALFKEKFNYDIIDILPLLFKENSGYQKARYDYWSLISELYVSSFGKQIFDWCEEHNCELTGHSIQEGSMIGQMICSAGVMPFYEYMQIPGIDWLGRQIDSPIVPKSLGSVSNQLGKKFSLTETFALCGWDVSFEELKWIAEWQYVNGVNLMCQHLESYTLKGLRKRDYPASLFYHQSWWEEYKLFNDYFSRLGMLLTQGKNVAKTLLIHPMKSGWIAYNWSYSDAIKKLDKEFEEATNFLSNNHIEHHYGDETIITKHGKVDGNKFIVGQCSYDTVILPSMLTIDENTLGLLKTFSDKGGNVYSIGDLPTLCSGNDIDKDELTFIIKIDNNTKIVSILEQTNIKKISILENNEEISNIHIQERDLGNKQLYYMVNHSQTDTYKATIKIKANGSLEELNLLDNVSQPISTIEDGDYIVANIEFLPMQSHVIVLNKNTEQCANVKDVLIQDISLGDIWNIEDVGYNSLTLDNCTYKIDGGEKEESLAVIRLMEKLLNLKRSCNVELNFSFEIDMNLDLNKEMYLAIESPEQYKIYVNDQLVQYDGKSWWKDSAFKKIDIKDHVMHGKNVIKIDATFYQDQKVYDVLFGEDVLETELNKLTYNTELESIYIVGYFGVISDAPYTYGERKAIFTDEAFVITDSPTTVKTGSITEQGFCFFAESITLSQAIEVTKNENAKQVLNLGKPNAVLSKVLVNDIAVKLLPWAPYKVDISDYLNEGKNKISVKLYSGNRNLLGPHHNAGGELHSVGPSSFTDKPGWEHRGSDDIWRDGYCFVKFGLEK